MAWVRNEEEFRVDDPFDNPLGATDNRDIGFWIGGVLGEKAKKDALGGV